MAKIVKLNVGGQEIDAVEQAFDISSEDWSVYKLADGGIVRVKTTVQKIYRVVDANGKATFSPEGDPNVLVKHSTQIVASDAS
jgi:hypothetical protein